MNILTYRPFANMNNTIYILYIIYIARNVRISTKKIKKKRPHINEFRGLLPVQFRTEIHSCMHIYHLTHLLSRLL